MVVGYNVNKMESEEKKKGIDPLARVPPKTHIKHWAFFYLLLPDWVTVIFQPIDLSLTSTFLCFHPQRTTDRLYNHPNTNTVSRSSY